jgi:predicted ATPase
VQTLLPATESPLLWVGRKLKGLASKRSSVVAQIYGEAGIGKTRAVTELLQTLPCASITKRAVASIPELIATLPKPKKVSSWLSSQLERLEDNVQAIPVVAAYLESLAPFVLHVEDLHECDQARVALWQALVIGLQTSKGVGLILTSRVKLDLSCESFCLQPLNLQTSTALLENEIAAVLPQEAGAWIYARAAGNPLFTLEYFRHLARLGFLWNDLTRWQWREPPIDSMPVTVEALIEQLLLDTTVTAESSLLLQARAYIETRVPQLMIETGLLLALTELTPLALETAESNLQRQGILGANGFKHPLF